jgi:predicted nucleotide-binding protein (sugar kinase/HSP70/actin superfamily)
MAKTIQMVAAVSGYRIAISARMIISVHMLSCLPDSIAEQSINMMIKDIPRESKSSIVAI